MNKINYNSKIKIAKIGKLFFYSFQNIAQKFGQKNGNVFFIRRGEGLYFFNKDRAQIFSAEILQNTLHLFCTEILQNTLQLFCTEILQQYSHSNI